MPASNVPSEFGGNPQRNTIQPPVTPRGHKGHTDLTNDELLRLGYLTGQTTDTTKDPDGGEAFAGLMPLSEAAKINPPPEPYPLE
jgi:hypothetical protein